MNNVIQGCFHPKEVEAVMQVIQDIGEKETLEHLIKDCNWSESFARVVVRRANIKLKKIKGF